MGICATALTSIVLAAPSAQADTAGHWADIDDWDPTTGTATVSMTGVTGFPDGALVTTSATGAFTGRISGASTWLAASTAPGDIYGSSRDRPYLSLRPAATNASSPSTSTYTFATPTPASGWSFALGDIDAEYLDIRATGEDGQPVAIEDLGFRSSFNYCLGASTPSCSATKPQPTPDFDPATGRASGQGPDVLGDGWSDTDGAAVWFSPTVPLRSLTITSTWRAGRPTFQTWFAAESRAVTGTVTGPNACSIEGLTVSLRDTEGSSVATTRTTADGTWSFPAVATREDWSIEVAPPTDCEIEGDPTPTADVSETDAVVDTELREADSPTPTPDPTPDPTQTPADPAGSSSPAAVVPAASTSRLPDTGGPDLRILEAGTALVLLGSAAVVVDRRRRRA